MNQTEGRASGEVPESQPSGRDLADKIASRLAGIPIPLRDHPDRKNVARILFAPIIRESLAPIREALEDAEWGTPGSDECPWCGGAGLSLGHDKDCKLAAALRLLRGEELSGNRGVGGGE